MILFLLLLLIPTPSRAVEEEIVLYRGVRSMGMGGVVTTTGDYAEALFNNPARHSEVEDAKFSLLDITLSTNSNVITSYKDFSGVSGSSGSSTITKAAKVIGKNQHARSDILIGYYNPRLIGKLGFALAMLVDFQANIGVHYTTDVGAQALVNVGPNLGLSHRFLEDRLSAGINIHTIYRLGTDSNVSALDFLTGAKGLKVGSLAHQGIGLDADIGGYYFIPWNIRPVKMSAGASLNNVIQSSYRRSGIKLVKNLGDTPPANDRLLNTGVRFDFLDLWLLHNPVVAFEIQNIGTPSKLYTFFKRVHFGGETRLLSIFSLRGGFNQGYWCAGFGLNLPLLKIDIASYGQELSSTAGVLEDRRYMLRLALEI